MKQIQSLYKHQKKEAMNLKSQLVVLLIVLLVGSKGQQKEMFGDENSLKKEGISKKTIQTYSYIGNCQSNIGCTDCDENGACDGCIDVGRAVLNGENQCECYFEDQSFDSAGYCVQCRINGCEVCQNDGNFRPTTCLKCLDPSAKKIEGKCVCEDDEIMLDGICSQCPTELVNGKCEPCPILGCAICEDGQTCDKCTHPSFWSAIQNGQCRCTASYQTFNYEGTCSYCMPNGCEICKGNNYYEEQCAQCIDEAAVLDEGQCSCQDVEMGQNGYCLHCSDSCDLIGCSCCNEGGCLQCIDDFWAVVNDKGQCQCTWSVYQKPNSNGICEFCLVEGCASCVAGSFWQCHQCSDPTAINEETSCVCPDGTSLSADGLCFVCEIPGCLSCSTSDTCYQCGEGLVVTDDGKCQCENAGEMMNEDGVCFPCQVQGCESCPSSSSPECLSCTENSYLHNNQCYCLEGKNSFNEQGICSECYVRGCNSCYDNSPYTCRQCEDFLYLEDGSCNCPVWGEKVNSDGICESCDVQGCASCKAGSPDVCVKCSNCSMFLIDGECICPETEDSESCFQDGEEEAIQADNTNIRVKDTCPQNCLTCRDNICSQCGDGFYLQGESCFQCNPRCNTCQNGVNCLSFRPGWGSFQGKVKHCVVPHCSVCSTNIGKCEQCKEHYILRNASFCEPDEAIKQISSTQNDAFEEFMRTYGKAYDSQQEREKREKVFYQTLQKIQDVQEYLTYEIGLNKFSDLTQEELEKIMRSLKPPPRIQSTKKSSAKISSNRLSSFPESLNWTEKGAITSVKDQGSCGSCWAFAGAGAAESTLVLSGKADLTIDLSEQYLLQCTYQSTCQGTYDMNHVMTESLEGIPTEATYPYNPYTNYQGICSTSERVQVADNYFDYRNLNDDQIIEALQNGPQVIILSADNWQSYSSGIFTCSPSDTINHAVLLVGYTSEYWIVKNQWGTGWGQYGYIRISRNPSQNCFIGEQLLQFEFDKCAIPGCLQCKEGDLSVCSQCHESSSLVNGVCECEEGEVMANDQCVACQVPGCSQCEAQDPYTCSQCEELKILKEGRCECQDPTHKMTNQNTCVVCEVDGCEFCQAGTQNICIKCIDCSASIINGECSCQDTFIMNEAGFCILNEAALGEGCESPFVLVNGSCSCPSNFVLLNQQCVECTLQNCEQCAVGEDNVLICSSCSEGLFPVNGVCEQCSISDCLICATLDTCQQCVEGKVFMEGSCQSCPTGQYYLDNQCHECVIQNCLWCNATTCTQCDYFMVLSNGECRCQEGEFFENNECQPCTLENCHICASLSVCQECFDGTVLKNGNCQACAQSQYYEEGECKQCPQFCVKCSSEFQCEECVADKALVDGVCTDCLVGEFQQNGFCYPCKVQHCLSCSSSDTCDLCETGLVFDEGECQQCEAGKYEENGACIQCSDACLQCSSSESCSLCEDGKQLYEGQCYQCQIDGCISCLSPQECESCESSHFLEGGRCYECSLDGCEQCSSRSECLKCQDGKVVENGICTACSYPTFYFEGICYLCSIEACQICESPSYCKTCQSGTVKNEEGRCEECPSGFLYSDGECVSCEVKGCESCSEVGLCSRCFDQNASPNHEQQCECQQPFVMTQSGYCFEEPEQPSQTTDEGSFTTDTGEEVSCSPGCSSCQSSSTCTRCLSNYFKEGEKCIKCDSSCLTCNGATANDCLSCPYGFYQSGSICLECDGEECLKCSSETICQSCTDTFTISEGKCVRCPDNCEQCSSPTVCTSCAFGFALAPDDSCQECLSSCSKCLSTDIRVCEACAVGRYLFSGQCLQCEGNCLECDSSTQCTRCSAGFTLENGNCSKVCTRPCLACSFENQEQKCSKCLGGYTLQNRQCQPDYSCNAFQNCSSCPYGSALVENVCKNCETSTSNCKQCSSDDLSKCLSCSEGYFLEDNSCMKCNQGCDECQSNNFCVTCSEGYFNILIDGANAGKCAKCQYPCLTCSETASSCATCVDGYSKEDGWKCVSDLQVVFFILIDVDIAVFLLRISEFRLFIVSLTGIPESSVTLNLVESGSVQIEGSVQTESSDEGQAIFEDLDAGFQEGKSILGYPVMKSEIKKENIQTEDEDKDINVETGEEEGMSLGVIIGIAAGGLVLVVSGIIGLYCWNKKKAEKTKGEAITSDEKIAQNKKTKSSSAGNTTTTPIANQYL